MSTATLKPLGFELAYLSLLTCEGLKSLSRWEKEFSDATRDTLHALGLKTRVVERTVPTGRHLRELLFSASEDCLATYASRFDRQPIARRQADTRFEGLLFGYPACCVESYATRGYAKNRLRRSDQRLLFHWACPQCAVTPRLIPDYRRVYRECRRLLRERRPACGQTARARTGPFRRAMAMAASLVALGALPALGAPNPVSPDPHWLALQAWEDPDADFLAKHYIEHGGCSWQGAQLLDGADRVDLRQLQGILSGLGDGHWLAVPSDTDGDLLADGEEPELGMNPANADEDRNQVLDGVDLAQRVAAEIAALPTGPVIAPVHRLDFPLRGLERCDICGTNVNMGHLTVCNEISQLYAALPYIGLHYMEHGSFSFAGDVHGKARTDLTLLLEALHSTGPSHQLPVSDDSDHDGLKDFEEAHFGTRPDLPDTDGDGVPDGMALARRMHRQLMALPDRPIAGSPYLIRHEANCVAPCPVCGEFCNCGHVEVTSRWAALTLNISFMNLHFLEHGSFAASAEERIDPLRLEAMLRPAVLISAGEGELTLRWLGQAGRTYQVFTAPAVDGPWVPGPTFTGEGRELTFASPVPSGGKPQFFKVVARD